MKFPPLQYIDAHCHLNFPAYDADREEVYTRARAAGVGMIIVGVDVATSQSAIAFAETHEAVWVTVGIHPLYVQAHTDIKKELAALAACARHEKVVGIGECGFDYTRLPSNDREQVLQCQRAIFAGQIDIAASVNKPLMLHVRGEHAYADVIALLQEKSQVGGALCGNAHFFSGTSAEADALFQLGFTISFTGVITFAEEYHTALRHAPASLLLSETDAPYVAPVPFRGHRNEPLYVREVVAAMATLRGEPLEHVRNTCFEAVCRMFKLSSRLPKY
jgi:TatD DNase family protein